MPITITITYNNVVFGKQIYVPIAYNTVITSLPLHLNYPHLHLHRIQRHHPDRLHFISHLHPHPHPTPTALQSLRTTQPSTSPSPSHNYHSIPIVPIIPISISIPANVLWKGCVMQWQSGGLSSSALSKTMLPRWSRHDNLPARTRPSSAHIRTRVPINRRNSSTAPPDIRDVVNTSLEDTGGTTALILDDIDVADDGDNTI